MAGAQKIDQKTDEPVPVIFKRANAAEEKCVPLHTGGPWNESDGRPQVHAARQQLLLPGRAAHGAGVAERIGSLFREHPRCAVAPVTG
jgi:hypothetical protein